MKNKKTLTKLKRGITIISFIISSLTLLTFGAQAENLVIRDSPALIQSPKKKIKIQFKLSGGMNYLSVGDWNTYMELDTKLNRDWAGLFDYDISGEFKKIHLGGEFAGDIIINLNSRIGISVGSGYIYGKKGKDSSRIFIHSRVGTEDQNHDTKISAIPIRLGIHYTLPLFSKTNIYFNTGIGYYFTSWSDNYYREIGPGWWEIIEQKAKAADFGLYGAVGLEYNLTHNTSFILETSGRYAKIGNFKGEYDYKNAGGFTEYYTGTLHYYETDYTFIGLDWYPVVKILKEKPDSPFYRNIREAKVNFSGFAVRIGIKLKF